MIEAATIKDWIEHITGYNSQHVIKGNQSGPRPIGDYASFYIVSIVNADYSIESRSILNVDEVTQNITNKVKVVLSVDVYADNGIEMLSKLALSNSEDVTRKLFQADNAVLLNGGSVRDLTFVNDTAFKSRFQRDFTIATDITLTQVSALIHEYDLTGTIDGDDINIIA